MRQFSRTGLMLGVCALAFLTGCQKEEQIAAVKPTAAKADVAVVDGMLAFKNMDTYQAYNHSLNDVPKGTKFDDFMQQKETKLGFLSLRAADKSAFLNKLSGARTMSKAGVEDDYLASLLNPDGMIQVGKWICRVDIPNESVYVLDEKDRNLIGELKQDRPAHGKIRKFSTDDDVLPMLESGEASGRVNILCFRQGGKPQDKAEGRDAQTIGEVDYYGYYQPSGTLFPHKFYADIKHVYQKAGIYFSLLSEMKYMKRYNTHSQEIYDQLSTEITLQCYWNYEVKCGGSAATVVPYEVKYTPSDNKLNWRVYEGTSGLHKYFINSTYIYKRKDNEHILDPNSSNPYTLIPNRFTDYERVTLRVLDYFN